MREILIAKKKRQSRSQVMETGGTKMAKPEVFKMVIRDQNACSSDFGDEVLTDDDLVQVMTIGMGG